VCICQQGFFIQHFLTFFIKDAFLTFLILGVNGFYIYGRVSFNKGAVKKGAFIRAPLKRASVKTYFQDLLFRIYICKIIFSSIYLGNVLHVLKKMRYFLLFNARPF